MFKQHFLGAIVVVALTGLWGSVLGQTYVVPLSLSGGYDAGEYRSFEFDMNDTLSEIHSVRFLCEGSVTAGLSYDWEPFSWSFRAFFDIDPGQATAEAPTVGASTYPSGEWFSGDAQFRLRSGATWDFLLGGRATVEVGMSPVFYIPESPPRMMPSGHLSSVSLVIEATPAYSPKYGGGTGEPNDPYQIWDANHMQAIGADANDWEKHFVLMADIDLAQFDGKDGREKFNMIGKWDGKEFTGVFDGNGFEIWNFTYSSSNYLDEHVGVFGYVGGSEALIKNLGLRDSHVAVDGLYSAGSLVGEIQDGNIADCYTVGGSITGGESADDLGGLVGMNRGATISGCNADIVVSASSFRTAGGLLGSTLGGIITQCHAEGDIVGDAAGGLIGRITGGGTVLDCFAIGDVSGAYGEGFVPTNTGGLIGEIVKGDVSKSHSSGDVHGHDLVGGLIGKNAGYDVRVSNCYSTGNVSGDRNVGGLVGRNIGLISNCYSIGSVSGVDKAGGLVGHNEDNDVYSGVIANSYWDVQTSGDPNMCGHQGEGATGCDPNCGKTTTEMKQQSTFTGWDFINVWDIGENQTYPYLRTHGPGDINKDRITNFLDLCIVAEQWMSGAESALSINYKVGKCDVGGKAGLGETLRFAVEVDGAYIDFEDQIHANCCIEKGIQLDVALENNVITVTETELSEGLCGCMCNYPTTARLGPFEQGTYVLQVNQIEYPGHVISIGSTEVTLSSE